MSHVTPPIFNISWFGAQAICEWRCLSVWHDSRCVPWHIVCAGTHERVMSHMWMSHSTNVNESCHVWNDSCHIQTRHVTYKFDMSRWIRRAGCVWVMSHMWTSYVTYKSVMSRTNESCHASNIRCLYLARGLLASHVTHVNDSCRIWMSDVICMNKSWHVWISHVTYEWVTSHLQYSIFLDLARGLQGGKDS